MPAIRPLIIMLRVLGYAAIPSWPLFLASAVLWSGRVELALLAVATTGSTSALTLVLLRAARSRSAQYARLTAQHDEQWQRFMAQRDAQYARLERLLVGAVASLHPHGRDVPTKPDLRVV